MEDCLDGVSYDFEILFRWRKIQQLTSELRLNLKALRSIVADTVGGH